MAQRRPGATAWCGCGGAQTACRGRQPGFRFARSALPTAGAKTRRTAATIAPSGCGRASPATGCGATDHLYDLVIEIDHNIRPRIRGRGSAVFIHVARPGLAPTAGCIALPAAALRRLLPRLGPGTTISIRR